MQQDRLADALEALGIGPQDHRVLLLLPLVYVAWANGTMSKVERERIIELASERLLIGPGGLAVLRHWLEERPSEKYFRDGLIDLVALIRAPDQPDVTSHDVQQVLADAEAIAREAARAEPGWSLNADQREALAEVGQLLGLDTGEPWNDLLSELGTPPREPPPALNTEVGSAELPRAESARAARHLRAAVRTVDEEDKTDDPKGGII